MPFVDITVAADTVTVEQVRTLQEGATVLMVDAMNKKAELTAVRVQQVPLVSWSVGGRPTTCAAHLDVKVSAGTNTSEEKARFIAGAMGLLRSVLGPALDPVTYVVIDEVPGDAWGWNGMTQARRAVAANSVRGEISAGA